MKELTLEAIYQEKIFETSPLREPHWMQDSKRFSYLHTAPNVDAATVWLYDIETGERRAVVDGKKLKLPKADLPPSLKVSEEDDDEDESAPGKEGVLRIEGYQWSPDEQHLLFARIPHRRAAGPGDPAIFVYTLNTGELKRVTHLDQPQRNVKWSPDSKRIGYVRGDDLYVLDKATGIEMRLTDTARETVYNGRFGWVYEEELDLVDGWAFSPDGKHIAYYQIDETPVPEIDLPNYADLHMAPVRTRYPKAGDPNPLVKIGLIDLPDVLVAHAPVPPTRWADIGAETDIYIARLQWTPHNALLLQRLPRLQNKIDLLKVDAATGKSSVILTEEDKAWVDVPGDLTFIKGTDEFLWPSDRSGYKHLYLYDLSGKLIRQVTQGDWDTDAISGVDATHRMVYFTAARPNPLERQLCSILLDGGNDVVPLSETPGTHSALFSPDAEHYLGTHSSRTSPPHTKLYRATGQPVAVVHENPMPKLEGHRLGGSDFVTFKTSDGVVLNAALLKPPGFDPQKKYPVLITTYGGPGSQVVQDEFQGGGFEQLLAQKGIISAMIDGRGSGARGRDFMKITYQDLGHWEVHDQIEGAKWLGSLPYVDAQRIGIWGWSYGGYMSSLCILKGADVFKMAIAVAPVTHWSLYDSIYTERYMRRPQDNPKGYEESAPIHYADKLSGKFLLVHGTADDNVHFQNSARLASALQAHNKQFRAMYYPGKHHGMEGASLHLFTMLTDFITTSL